MTSRLDGTGGPHVLVGDLAQPTLSDDDRHHLARVRRITAGSPITIGDGAGQWRHAIFGDSIEVAGDIVIEPKPEPALTVAFALVKGDRPEWVTQKLTELGIDVIVPFVAERSVVRWNAHRRQQNHDKLVRVARAAAMQSRRAWLPEISPVRTFDDVVAQSPIALAHRDGEPVTAAHTTVMIGPEGGWSERELDACAARVVLGPHVLRAETAALTAGALLSAHRFGAI